MSQVRLVESGLKVKEAVRSRHKRGAHKMAGETIDTTMTAGDKAAASDTCLTGLKSSAAFALTAERQVDLPTAASDNRA